MKKPNILFIISDQHNAKVLGCKGHPDVKTPSLDRMAEEGVRFDKAITQNPICTPSRVCFLSGQYPHNHGYYGLEGPNPKGLPTVLGHFRRAGYTTAAIGKIHCPEYWVEDDCDYFSDTYSDCSIEGGKEYCDYLRQRGLESVRDDIFYPEQEGKNAQSCDGRCSNLKYEDSVEGWVVRRTIEFMNKAREKHVPFIIQASLPRPHEIYSPSEPFWSMYDEKQLQLPPNMSYDMSLKAPNLKRTAEYWRKEDWTLFEPHTHEAGILRKLHGYLGCVSQVDYAVGELNQWLKDNGLEKNTIVIYSSDHGDYACEHGNMEKAPGICSDAITRIPFILKWPGHFKAGHVADEIIETVDLSQTLCLLAGLEPMETSDGRDLRRLLEGEHVKIHNVGVTEFVWSKSVCKGNYRLVYYPVEMFSKEYPQGFGELYDLEQDPWEMKNLYFDKNYEAIIKEMKEELLNWLITTSRPKTVLGLPVYSNDQVKTRFHNTFNFDGKINPEHIKNFKGESYI